MNSEDVFDEEEMKKLIADLPNIIHELEKELQASQFDKNTKQ